METQHYVRADGRTQVKVDPVKVDPADLAGVGDLARLFGVTSAAICNWAARYPDFPSPVTTISYGPIYRISQVKTWYRKRRS